MLNCADNDAECIKLTFAKAYEEIDRPKCSNHSNYRADSEFILEKLGLIPASTVQEVRREAGEHQQDFLTR